MFPFVVRIAMGSLADLGVMSLVQHFYQLRRGVGKQTESDQEPGGAGTVTFVHL